MFAACGPAPRVRRAVTRSSYGRTWGYSCGAVPNCPAHDRTQGTGRGPVLAAKRPPPHSVPPLAEPTCTEAELPTGPRRSAVECRDTQRLDPLSDRHDRGVRAPERQTGVLPDQLAHALQTACGKSIKPTAVWLQTVAAKVLAITCTVPCAAQTAR
jgi:hypothetical protein